MSDAASARLSPRAVWGLVAATYVGLTLVYAWPLLGVMTTSLPHDVGDPGLNTWILWWNSRALPLTERWWNAPIFYPAPGAFALSETFLSVAPLTTLLQWLGASAVVAYNVTFLISFPATALAAHALARRLTGRHDAAFIAGLAFGFCPWRTAQMPHLQMLLMWWMPLTLLALHRYLDRPSLPGGPAGSFGAAGRRRYLVLAGFCWLMNGLTSGYFLVFFGVLLGFWALWFLRTRRDWIAVAITMVVASAPLAPLLLGYHRVQSEFGLSRGSGEIEAFSADLSAIWAVSPDLWIPDLWTREPRAEGELYPGATILILAAIGVWIGWRSHRSGDWKRWRKIAALSGAVIGALILLSTALGGWRFSVGGTVISLTRPAKSLFVAGLLVAVAMLWDRRLLDAWRRRSVFFFYFTAAAVMLFFALGPTARALGETFLYRAPYAWLMELPGGGALRVPARFGVLFMFCLGQAAAIAFSRLLRPAASSGLSRGARFAGVALAVAVFLEGWTPKMPVDPVPPAFDLLRMRTETPLLELPILSGYTETAVMLRATRHGHTLINGTSGYSPPHYDPMVAGLQALDTSVLAALQAYGPFLVFVNHRLDENNKVKDLMDQVPDATPIGRSSAGTLYELPGRTPPSSATATEIPIASIDVSVKPEAAAAMIDRQLTTRWETTVPQAAGDRVVVTLQRPATITRVELDLGEFHNDYPRRLRVEVGTPGGPSKIVWQGPTSGLAVTGLLKDRVRLPIVLDLAEPAPGQQVTLTVVEGHPEYWWSIAEIRIFGT